MSGDTVPLSFGQLSVFRVMQELPLERWPETYMTNVIPLPARRTEDEVKAAVEVLAQRHESLRTSFFDIPRGAYQVVSATGRLDLDSVELPGCTEDEAWKLSRDRCRPPFDWESGSCWRAVIVTDRGTPTFLMIISDHIASDGWGLQRLGAEVRAMLEIGSDADTELLTATPSQPRELATAQRSDLWQPRRAATAGYWEALLRDLRPDVFPWSVPAVDDAGRIAAVLRSTRAKYALGRAAHRIGTSPHSVLLTLYLIAVRQVLGVDDLAFTLQAGNRKEPPWRNIVSSMNQYAPLAVAGMLVSGDVAALTRSMHQASRTAYSHGMYDLDSAREMVRRERGVELNFDCFFNYMANDIHPHDGSSGPSPEEPGVVERIHPYRQVGPRLDLRVQGGVATAITVRVDPTLLSREQLDRLMVWFDEELWELASAEQCRVEDLTQRCAQILGKSVRTAR